MPQPKKHENQEWFHPNVTREQAETVLIHLGDGSFLVRSSEHDSSVYVISFTWVNWFFFWLSGWVNAQHFFHVRSCICIYCFHSCSAYRKVKHCRINVEGRLYVVGESLFESLVSLVHYYTRNPLYRNVKLVFPISKDVMKTMSKKYGNGTMVW